MRCERWGWWHVAASGFVLATGQGCTCGGADGTDPPTTEEAGDIAVGTLDTEDGRTRRYFTYWPESAAERPPLLLVLHGGGGTALGAQTTSFTHAAAEKHGWFTVYPEGVVEDVLGKPMATWNAGACCGKAKKEEVDDVGFLIALLDELAKDFRFDEDRVFVTGISNGGMMATKLACDRPDRIAGFSAVGSPGYGCEEGEPVAAQIIHGTEDPCAFYAGGKECGGCWERAFTEATGIPLPKRSFACTGAEDQVAQWRRINGCSDEHEETFRQGDATCVRYGACESGKPVSLCTIDGGGHTWPGGELGCDPQARGCKAFIEVTGPTSEDLDANDAIVEAFRAMAP